MGGAEAEIDLARQVVRGPVIVDQARAVAHVVLHAGIAFPKQGATGEIHGDNPAAAAAPPGYDFPVPPARRQPDAKVHGRVHIGLDVAVGDPSGRRGDELGRDHPRRRLWEVGKGATG